MCFDVPFGVTCFLFSSVVFAHRVCCLLCVFVMFALFGYCCFPVSVLTCCLFELVSCRCVVCVYGVVGVFVCVCVCLCVSMCVSVSVFLCV